jgi:hypothetical protein
MRGPVARAFLFLPAGLLALDQPVQVLAEIGVVLVAAK